MAATFRVSLRFVFGAVLAFLRDRELPRLGVKANGVALGGGNHVREIELHVAPKQISRMI